jgi:hypothetical protein
MVHKNGSQPARFAAGGTAVTDGTPPRLGSRDPDQTADEHAHDEADQVRHVGHAGTLSHAGPGRIDVLQDEPGTEDQPGGQPDRQEEQEGQQREHPGSGVEDQVGTEHARDRSGGSDQGRRRATVHDREPVRSSVSSSDVERDERDPAEPVLDVVAEDVEEEHVAEDVQPSGMQEHRVEHR